MRRQVALLLVVALLAIAILAQLELARVPREDPLGRRLLCLPSQEMLSLASLGNRGLVADLLYLWAIQYYSQFEPPDTFLYLQTVFGLITDLDPRYVDAYRIGAMIMEIEAGGHVETCKAEVRALFDKGIAATPDDYRLPEIAAWDGYMIFRDQEMAIDYAGIAAARPNAPHRIKRVYGRWKDRSGVWSLEDSLAYWQEAIDEAESDYERTMSRRHMYDVVVKVDRRRLEPLLRAFAGRAGRCPRSWQELVDLGWLPHAPLDYAGNPYGLDAEACTLVPHKRIRG